MTWTAESVRIRFVEAAATERFLQGLKRLDAGGYWPQYFHDEEDIKGWTKETYDDHMEIWQGRGTAKADALSRYQECLSWTIERIDNPERRRLIWGFAFCRAYKREFGKWCEERGLKKSTSYNRLNRVWDHLAFNLNLERILWREASPYWVGHETPRMACRCATDAPSNGAVTAIKFTPSYRTEPSRDLIQTQDDADTFAKFLDRRNARLRKINGWRNEEVA